MMSAQDVIEVLNMLEAAGVASWLDGGWGVDALIGEQTRSHVDLDLVITLDQAAAVRAALRALGFVVVEDELPTRFVMGDSVNRRIDFHTVIFDSAGGGIQRLQDGTSFRYPPEGFADQGHVGALPVRCLSAKVQVLCHTGYMPDADDIHDLRLLHDRLGIASPTPSSVSATASRRREISTDEQ